MENQNTEIDPSFLEIDQDQLDKEWLRQPKLVFEFAVQLSDARNFFDMAKTRADVMYAELDSEIRKNPDQYDITKVSEAAIRNAIYQEKSYKIKQMRVLKARKAMDVLQAAVTALEHKKRALESLVTLFGQNYFSAPHASSINRDNLDEMTKRSVRKQHIR